MPHLREQFLLDPEIHYFNHGSFGACPRPVFAAYHEWQLRLERQPVHFLVHQLPELLQDVRARLAEKLVAHVDELALVPNDTYAINVVARSIHLQPGDEILATGHEYGACDNTWEFVCGKAGARYIHQPIPLPAPAPQEILEQMWNGVTPRTRLIFISHITSPTALILPVAEVCRGAREAGVLSMVDGAHAPGQIPLDLHNLGADFYSGNCHKWMLTPKGSAFLYTRRDVQELIEPLVVSWGWQADATFSTGSKFIDNLQWVGTDDPSAYLAIPAAIDFMEANDWDSVRSKCHQIARCTLETIHTLTGLESIYTNPETQFAQMAAITLPKDSDLEELKRSLYDDYKIEIPCMSWNGMKFIRLSVQGYNTPQDLDALVDAITHLLRTKVS